MNGSSLDVRGSARMMQLFVLAASIFLLGVGVYVLDRPAGGAYLLPPWLALHVPGQSLYGSVGEWLPSFAHSFLFTVLTAAALPATQWRPLLAGALWCLIGGALELGQHPALSQPMAAALPAWFADVPVLDHLGGYWRGGTFDLHDLAAVVVGCALAAALVQRIGNRATHTEEPNHVGRN